MADSNRGNDPNERNNQNAVTVRKDYPWNSALSTIIEVIVCGISTGISCSQLYFRLTGHQLPSTTIGIITGATTAIYIYLREQQMMTAMTVRNISISTSLAALLFELNAYLLETAGASSDETTAIDESKLPEGSTDSKSLFNKIIIRIFGSGGDRKVYLLPGKLHGKEVEESGDKVIEDISQNGVQGLTAATALVASNADDILKGDLAQPTNTVSIDGQVKPPAKPPATYPLTIYTPIPQAPPIKTVSNSVAEHVADLNNTAGVGNIIGNKESTSSTLKAIETHVSDMVTTTPNLSMGSGSQIGGSSGSDKTFFENW